MSKETYPALTRPPDPGAPLIFAFHGTGGDERQFFGLAAGLVPGAGVVAPRGDVTEGEAPRFFRLTGDGGYDLDDLRQRARQMMAFVEAWRDTAPDAPAYAFGYSNGANILAALLLANPHLFVRTALLHPLVSWPMPEVDLSGVPVLVSAGRRDPVCPWPATETLLADLEARGARLTREVHPGGHELRQSELDALRVFFNP
ncbi:MAG: alpha/beta hydrolase [Pseudomonadota bacterium]